MINAFSRALITGAAKDAQLFCESTYAALIVEH